MTPYSVFSCMYLAVYTQVTINVTLRIPEAEHREREKPTNNGMTFYVDLRLTTGRTRRSALNYSKSDSLIFDKNVSTTLTSYEQRAAEQH